MNTVTGCHWWWRWWCWLFLCSASLPCAHALPVSSTVHLMWSSFRSNGNNQISYIIWLLMHIFFFAQFICNIQDVYLCAKPLNCAITWNYTICIPENTFLDPTSIWLGFNLYRNKIIIYRELNSRKCNEFYSNMQK